MYQYEDDSFMLHTDLYQINMAEVYYNQGIHNRTAIFDLYFRRMPFENGYAVFAGLERIIDYLSNLRFTDSDIEYLRSQEYSEEFLGYLKGLKFTGNLRAVEEGEVVFNNMPLVQVEEPLAEAQLIETALLNIVNYQTLIATKASRIRHIMPLVQVEAPLAEAQLIVTALLNIVNYQPLIATKASRVRQMTPNEKLMEFGSRRAHEFDASIWGARAEIIGGFDGTSNVRPAKLFDLPPSGTHAHSMIQAYGDDYEAFKAYATTHEDCVFLVDTFDTLRSGVPN